MHMRLNELFPNYVPRPPLPRKVGVMTPQRLWERRPWSVASPGFCVRGAQVWRCKKRPKIINVHRTSLRQQPVLPSMRHCIWPVCHSHTRNTKV